MAREVEDVVPDAFDGEFVFTMVENFADEAGNLLHLRFFHAACRNGGRADADAGRDEWAFRVERNRVFIHRDVGLVQSHRRIFARDVDWCQVDEHEVIVGTAGNNAESDFGESRRHRLRIFYDLFAVFFERGLQRFVQANSFGRDDVHERAALDAWENLAIDIGGKFFTAHHQAAARTA